MAQPCDYSGGVDPVAEFSKAFDVGFSQTKSPLEQKNLKAETALREKQTELEGKRIEFETGRAALENTKAEIENRKQNLLMGAITELHDNPYPDSKSYLKLYNTISLVDPQKAESMQKGRENFSQEQNKF